MFFHKGRRWFFKNFLSPFLLTTTGLEPRTTYFLNEHSIIWPHWPSSWLFVYELSGFGFESSCSQLNFKIRTCFEQGVPWHSGNYRVLIHSKTRTWHDKNIQPFLFIGTTFAFFPFWGQRATFKTGFEKKL